MSNTELSIQLFVPKFRVDECLREIGECLNGGWTGLGYKTAAFEEAWKGYTRLPHAHCLNSNTAGLHLALEVLKHRLGWCNGDEVITTPFTFVASNHAILHAGLKPVFADIDESLCLDPDDIEKNITAQTRAVMFVGLGGNVGQYERVVELCRQHGIALILDAAHMAGTRLYGRHVGHEADAVVFSFQAVKNLPTADAGMVCFARPEDDELARKLSWLGINKDTYARTVAQGAYQWRYEVDHVGYKYHGNSIMAAIGLVQLRYLDADNAYRRQLATWYRELLAHDTHIRLIPGIAGCESATHLFQIRVHNRDDLMVRLNANEVYPGVHYRDNTEYPMYAEGRGRCPRARIASREIISLPLHLGMTRHNVETVAKLVKQFAE
ncbi:Aminotransferase DegT [Gammaproteobacteria bacterium]